MRTEDRKQAISAWKERAAPVGIYAVRCEATGAVWVGAARDLDAIGNRVLFTLRSGGHPNRSLQDAWRAHGPEGVRIETLEVLDKDTPAISRGRVLKARHAHWCAALGAVRI